MSDRTDPEVIKKGSKEMKLRLAREREDVQKVMKTPHGRRVMWRILEQSKMLATDLFAGDERTNVNIGRRDMGVWLYNEIMLHAPEQFIKVLQERVKERVDAD
jgi:hypothetical protein